MLIIIIVSSSSSSRRSSRSSRSSRSNSSFSRPRATRAAWTEGSTEAESLTRRSPIIVCH